MHVTLTISEMVISDMATVLWSLSLYMIMCMSVFRFGLNRSLILRITMEKKTAHKLPISSPYESILE